ncbi:glycosyltransferase [Pedobacter sp. N36a]|uniref:glycosyltransferase n=1 Tax=Pedobacter sp. N36a TaxID=2767996 RepID=UPI00165717FB|nr:glycosyltransferase [Pedobacter sp. N36a]MBC8985441.1 glycosyltransferase [Pedobacter sp. N36a]
MKKIKVIEAVNQLGLGGTEYALQLYSKFFDKSCFEVTVVALLEGGARVKLIEDLGIKVMVLNGDLNQFAELLKETDVLHWHGNGILEPDLYQVIKRNKPKIVIQTNVFGLFENATYDVIDYDLFISKMILVRRMGLDKKLKDNFEGKRKVLPYPVDVDHLSKLLPEPSAVLKFKKQKNLNGFFVVGRIGRADDNKFDLISLDGFKIFAEKVSNARFLLLGATPKMRAHAQKLGITDKLIICENTSDLQELLYYYKTIDIFLAASAIGESFGMVIAEAMTAGTPVLTISTEDRDNAQIELVDHHKTGMVTKADQHQIASALQYLYEDEAARTRLSSASKEKIVNAYKAQKIVGSLEQLIYKHLGIESNTSVSLVDDFSKDLINEYTRRCLNTYGRSEFMKSILWQLKKIR